MAMLKPFSLAIVLATSLLPVLGQKASFRVIAFYTSTVERYHVDFAHDAVIFYNFRADRARQMTRALVEPGFDKITDRKRPKNLFYVAMTQYDKNWPWLKYVIAPEKLEHILAQVFEELHGGGELAASGDELPGAA